MNVAVVGAGSWGTTIADLMVRNGHQVAIWAREPEVVTSINQEHVNRLFLPDAALQESLVAYGDVADSVRDADVIVSAAPSHAVREVSGRVGKALNHRTPLVVSISKGLEEGTLDTMSQVLEETVAGCPVVVLSGPSFAKEVFAQQPTALVAASEDAEAAELVQRTFSNPRLRVYTSGDVVGVELGAALKNVIAVAAGILDGLGLGHNPRAALITRGLAEITRLAEAMGADPLTLAGLAGVGDLVLTATGGLSRNRSLGVEIGRGRNVHEILGERRTVAEGVRTAHVAVELGDREGVELPIAREVTHIFDGKSPREAIGDLMGRELKAEQWR
jgi:glycerol-3-phosphate dehydrogenase (NAD(P)+)